MAWRSLIQWCCAAFLMCGCRAVLDIEAGRARRDAGASSDDAGYDPDPIYRRNWGVRVALSEREGGVSEAGAGGTGGSPCPDAVSCEDASAGGASGTGGTGGVGPSAGSPSPGSEPCSEPDAIRCDDSAAAERSRCDATSERWLATTACENGEVCDRRDASCKPVVAACVGAAPGDVVCSGSDRHTCGPDLVSSEVQTCADAAHCQAAAGSSCATCIDGEHSCDGVSLRVCNATHDGWGEVMTCASSALCNAAAGQCTSAVCVEDQHRCVGDQLQVCNSTQTDFVPEEACDSGLCDATGGQCDVCNANSCVNRTTRVVCSRDGQTRTKQSCPTGTPVCVNQGACVECSAPSDCTAAPCTFATCSANRCGSRNQPAGTACGTNGVCNGAGTCGECRPDALRCAKRQPQECTAGGQWQNLGSACTADQLCRDGQCVNNPPYVEGYLSPLNNPSQLGGSILYALAFTINAPARVLGVGVQARSPVSAVRAIMGVYGSSGARPGTLLATSSEVVLQTGANDVAFSGAVVLAQAGTYWVVGTFSAPFDTWDAVGGAGSSAFYSTPYAQLPMSFPSTSFSSSVLRNFYVRLQNTQ